MKPAASWLALCTAYAAISLLAWPSPREPLDWQPALIAQEPWRILTAAFIHWTPLHLAANLAGCAVLALLGWRAQLNHRQTLAALIALPITQLALLLRPDLHHYAGLSGALHAMVAITALSLATRRSRDRWIGISIGVGLAVKLALEHPFGPALQHPATFDFPVAPFAHLAGALAGAIAWRLTIATFNRTKLRNPYGT
jgi:rhomboid family GlyGly-CTERM serine protease